MNKLTMEQRVNVGIHDLRGQLRDAAMERGGALSVDMARKYLEAAGQFRQLGNFEEANNKLLLGFESLQNLYTAMVKNVEIPKLVRDAGKAVGNLMIIAGFINPFTWSGGCIGPDDGEGSGHCFLDDTRCLSDRSLFVCYDTQRSGLKVDCKEGWQCEDAKCRPMQGQSDPECPQNSRSACVITDVFDFGEGYSDHKFTSNGAAPTFVCPDDESIVIENRYHHLYDWAALTMNIMSPRRASYYDVDLKISSWSPPENPSCSPSVCIPPTIEILFGGDQKKNVPYSSAWEASKCTYMNGVATFGTAGITSSDVRMTIRNNKNVGEGQVSAFTLAKMRLWSCECGQ